MFQIKNENYDMLEINRQDLFICTLGYEERSKYLIRQIAKKIDPKNILIFVFDNLVKLKNDTTSDELRGACKYTVISAKYDDASGALTEILHFLSRRKPDEQPIRLHVDYSSMPRSWYCQIPQVAEQMLQPKDKIYFWYVGGHYKDDYHTYPSAGVDSFSLFSGKPTLRTDKKRIHMLALSYDTIRTQAIISMLDPDCFVVCDAFDTERREIHDNVLSINAPTISHAIMSFSLHMNDFSFMIAKLCEMANICLPDGDVVFVPDGPKPLIFAMSLVPQIVGKSGITCLHIARNNRNFAPLEVFPTDRVIGFSLINYAM